MGLDESRSYRGYKCPNDTRGCTSQILCDEFSSPTRPDYPSKPAPMPLIPSDVRKQESQLSRRCSPSWLRRTGYSVPTFSALAITSIERNSQIYSLRLHTSSHAGTPRFEVIKQDPSAARNSLINQGPDRGRSGRACRRSALMRTFDYATGQVDHGGQTKE